MSATGPPNNSPAPSPADYPALRSFLRGYFHQDMKEEYGSADEAVREFCADASTEERTAVAQEWARFMDQAKGWPMEEINRILTGPLGSSCLLTEKDLQDITAVLLRARKPGPH
jgi:hypothetical protein